MTELTEKEILNYMFTVYFGNLENRLSAAIKRAYRDFNRTQHGFGKTTDNEEIRKKCSSYLEREIICLLNVPSISQDKFDDIHKKICDGMKNIYGTFNFTYGQAQKWINMTLKYYYLLDREKTKNAVGYFHIPIDNIVIEKISKFNPPKIETRWSKLNDYSKYLEFQSWFRKTFDGIPLINEFKIWDK